MTKQTYTGDLSLALDGQGDWDITYENGQPLMTDGFDTCITLAIFGEPDFWQNELTNDPNEKYISDLPDVIKTGRVNNDTINNGTAAIKNALDFMISSNMAKTINVTGSILTVYSIQWTIEITKPDDTDVKFLVNWNKGVIENASSTNS